MPYKLLIRLQIRSPPYADAIQEALDADAEPRPQKIARRIFTDSGFLCIEYASPDLKLIRTASSGLLENLNLAIQVVNELSPEAMGANK